MIYSQEIARLEQSLYIGLLFIKTSMYGIMLPKSFGLYIV